MATFTTAASGNESNGATWVGGVSPNPLGGDNIIVATTHILTFDRNFIAGSATGNVSAGATAAIDRQGTGSTPGQIIIGNGITFILRGDIIDSFAGTTPLTGKELLIIGAGVIFEFDTSTTSPPTGSNYLVGPSGSTRPNCSVIINGTVGARTTIRSNLGGVNGFFSTRGFSVRMWAFTATYTDFIDVGTVTSNAIPQYPDGTYDLPYIFRHCTFNRCGKIGFNLGISGAQTFILEYVFFENSLHASENIILSHVLAKTTGTRKVYNCHFDKNFGVTSHLAGIDFRNNVFQKSFFPNTTSLPTEFFINNLVTGAGDTIACGDITDCYMVEDNEDANPHILNITPNRSITIDGLIMEVTNKDRSGDGVLSAINCPALTHYYTKNCIALPNPDRKAFGSAYTLFGGGIPTGNGNVKFHWTNNTQCCDDKAAANCESGNGTAGILAEFKNNIIWSLNPATIGMKVWDLYNLAGNNGIVEDLGAPADLNYNCGYNFANTYPSANAWLTNQGRGYGAKYSSTPGVNDIVADPQFVDYKRNMPTFATAYLGQIASATWTSHTGTDTFAIGNIKSHATANFYASDLINFRCILAHTKNTANSEPGVGTSWRTYWEFSSRYLIREAMRLETVYNDSSIGLVNGNVVSALCKWIKKGYQPTNPLLRDAGFDGSDIGAVPMESSANFLLNKPMSMGIGIFL